MIWFACSSFSPSVASCDSLPLFDDRLSSNFEGQSIERRHSSGPRELGASSAVIMAARVQGSQRPGGVEKSQAACG